MKQRGISLIEIIISILIIGGAIAVFAVLFSTLKVSKTGTLYTQAYKLAQEEMEAVRALPLSELTTRTDADFINVLHNNGSPGGVNGAMKVSVSSTSMGIISLPYDTMADFTLEANVKASPIATKSGLLFRARDLENYYFFYVTSDRLALEENINGSITALYESFQSFTSDTYYKLKVVTSGANISLYLNDNLVQTISDDSFANGRVALASTNALTTFDDVTLDGTTWNFTDLSAGELPGDWKRFGINDLPSGSGKLTISEPFGSSDIKKIDVTISWVEREDTKTVTLSTLKSE